MGNPREPIAKSVVEGARDGGDVDQASVYRPPTGDARDIESSLTIVEHSYTWFTMAAQKKLETLRGELKKEDEPPLSERLLLGVLNAGLGAGAAAAGVRVANALVNGDTRPALNEFVKVMFEAGVGAGVEAGKGALAAGSKEDTVDAFMDSQIEGVIEYGKRSQDDFIDHRKWEITTKADADALRKTATRETMRGAADAQYQATRDAWLVYLAQSRFGTSGSSTNAKTNMEEQWVRDDANAKRPGSVPAQDPHAAWTKNRADGVLSVQVSLPPIWAAGGPIEVVSASINGVNGTIRSQYEGASLASVNVPRIVYGYAPGAGNILVSLDEAGNIVGLDADEHGWFAARALVGHPENASKDERARAREGVRLLLRDIQLPRVQKEIF